MQDRTMGWLLEVTGRKKGYVVLLAAVQSMYGFFGVLYALLLRNVVDAAAGGDADGFAASMTEIILLALAQAGLRAVIRRTTEAAKSEFENRFKGRLAGELLRRDFLQVSAVHSGEWMNRLTNDCVVAGNGCAEIVPGILEMGVKLAAALVMLLFLEPGFAFVFLPGGAAMCLLTWLFRRRMKALHKGVQEADGRLRVYLQERIGSLLMVHSFASEGKTLEETEIHLKGHRNARLRRVDFSNFCNFGFGIAMSGAYLLGVGYCGYGILKGTVTFGTLTAVTQLISQIQTPFANITGYLPRWYAMTASAERLMEAEGYADSFKEPARGMNEVKELYDKMTSFGLDDASFRYADGREGDAVLRGVSLEIKKGEQAAFVGESGCGKSTALKLLTSVYAPSEGDAYCLTGGSRMALTPAWRRLFAYVPQGNHLMSGTIREVVCLADPDGARDEERIWGALRTACADGFVSELADGIDTLLGERGTGLSEGQTQRLAVARAVFSGSPVLLLDESTSALDMETERRLLDNLRSLKDRTVVIVTHRSTALEKCDRVFRFSEGRIEEGGEA